MPRAAAVVAWDMKSTIDYAGIARWLLLALWCAAQSAAAATAAAERVHSATAALAATRGSTDPRVYAAAQAEIEALRAVAPEHARLEALEAWMAMSLHRFSEALGHCDRALRRNPAEPIALALRADALTELGRYGEALAATQVLLDRAPPVVAFPRAAHLRFLHGDLSGAVELAAQALKLAPQGHPEHVWLSGDLALLLIQQGQAAGAVDLLQTLPLASAAEEGWLAQALLASGDVQAAAAHWRRAYALSPLPEYAVALWKLARARNDAREELRMARLLDGQAGLDSLQGGLATRDFIEYFALKGQLDRAENLARQELQRRPDVYSEAQLAWVLRLSGRPDQAAPHVALARRLGTRERRFGEWLPAFAAARPSPQRAVALP